MSEKPILFNAEMVRAILDGRKTVTRRIIKLAPLGFIYEDCSPARKPPVHPGDILWVRETWTPAAAGGFFYRASYSDKLVIRWHPSIHMPRDAARIFLKVKTVGVERLQSIQERGPRSAQAEGFINDIDTMAGTGASATKHFADLWDATIKKADLPRFGWDANPWVWVIEFEREWRNNPWK